MPLPLFCLCESDDRAQLLFEHLLVRSLVAAQGGGVQPSQYTFAVVQIAHRLVTAHCQCRDLNRSLQRIAEWVRSTTTQGSPWPSSFLLAGHPESWSAYAYLDGALYSLRSALDSVLLMVKLAWPNRGGFPRSLGDFIGGEAAWRPGNPDIFDSLKRVWSEWGESLRDYRDSIAHEYPYHQNSAPQVLVTMSPLRVICLLPDEPTRTGGQLLRFGKQIDGWKFAADALNGLVQWVLGLLDQLNPGAPDQRVTAVLTTLSPDGSGGDIEVATMLKYAAAGQLAYCSLGEPTVRLMSRDSQGRVVRKDVRGHLR